MEAATASTAAIRSPYAAGTAKADGSEGETTPGTRKLRPMNRNVCGTTSEMSAEDDFQAKPAIEKFLNEGSAR